MYIDIYVYIYKYIYIYLCIHWSKEPTAPGCLGILVWIVGLAPLPQIQDK